MTNPWKVLLAIIAVTLSYFVAEFLTGFIDAWKDNDNN